MSDSCNPVDCTIACQAPPSMGFPRQVHWSGLPFPSAGDLPDPGIEPRSPALQVDSLLTELQVIRAHYFSSQICSSSSIHKSRFYPSWIMFFKGNPSFPALRLWTQVRPFQSVEGFYCFVLWLWIASHPVLMENSSSPTELGSSNGPANCNAGPLALGLTTKSYGPIRDHP